MPDDSATPSAPHDPADLPPGAAPDPAPDPAPQRARPLADPGPTGGVKVGHLAARDIVRAEPSWTLRRAAREMHSQHVGSVIVEQDGALVGILTERDVLAAVGTDVDLDAVTVEELMTTEVVTVSADWEVYEATAEMNDHRIRHLVVTEGDRVTGVLSVRDLLLAGQRVELTGGNWAVLRDPLTFTVRERRRLQRQLLKLDAGGRTDIDVDGLIGELVGSWSFERPLPAGAEALAELDAEDLRLLRAAVAEELPALQQAVQPAPGWRRRD